MSAAEKRVALVTGANRGIGFEIARQLGARGYKVILTARDEKKGVPAAESLKAEGLDVIFHQLDVTDPAGVRRITGFVDKEFGRLDALVNNAGVYLDKGANFDGGDVLSSDLDLVKKTMETNFYGPLRLCQALAPLMKKHNYGRIVNMSSGMGQLHDMGSGSFAYRLSKTAINVLTRVLASELAGANILVNSCSPGWVRTQMGGLSAPLTPAQGADTPVFLATLPDGGPTGGFFKDRRKIEW
jgi:NAD(P)-dependent dehydrogenase (short-subunit alcohol dehydrogenase family)